MCTCNSFIGVIVNFLSSSQIITSCLEIKSFLDFLNLFFSFFKLFSDGLQTNCIPFPGCFSIGQQFETSGGFFFGVIPTNFNSSNMTIQEFGFAGMKMRMYVKSPNIIGFRFLVFILVFYSGFPRSILPLSIKSLTGTFLESNWDMDFSCLSINSSTFSIQLGATSRVELIIIPSKNSI